MEKPLQILLVEDETLIGMCLELELKQAGYIVTRRVTTGEDAVEFAINENTDIILMDIRLAGKLDGIEAARQIQAANPIPVIFMTGFSDNILIDRTLSADSLGYLIKPVRVKDIEGIIENHFSS